MRKWPDWFTYGRPFVHYAGAAVMAVLAILGAFLSAWRVWKTGLPWWGWMLVASGALGLLIYAHMRQWREWNRELRTVRLQLGGDIRLAWQEKIHSPHAQYPHGVKAIFQTKKMLPSIKFRLFCTAPVARDLIHVSYWNTTGGYMTEGQGGLSHEVLVSISSPEFRPESPLIVQLFGPKPFVVLGTLD